MRKLFIILILMVFWNSSALADTYSWKDSKGVKHFGVSPPDDATDVEKTKEIPYDAQKDEAMKQEYELWLNQQQQEREAEAAEKQKRHEARQKEAEKAQQEAEKAKAEAEKAKAEAEKAQAELLQKIQRTRRLTQPE